MNEKENFIVQSDLKIKENKGIDFSKFMKDNLVNILSFFGIVITIYAFYWAYKKGLLTDEEKLKDFISGFNHSAWLIFIFIQIVQTIIPIIPGALTIPVGVVIFGPALGFLYNYIGIMIGSVINFLLARHYGKNLVLTLVGRKNYTKFMKKMNGGYAFERIFTFGMFFPFSPADFLCYMAGLSNMKFKKYLIILSLGKPLTLFLYGNALLRFLEKIKFIFMRGLV